MTRQDATEFLRELERLAVGGVEWRADWYPSDDEARLLRIAECQRLRLGLAEVQRLLAAGPEEIDPIPTLRRLGEDPRKESPR